MEIVKDTPTEENEQTHPADPQKTGSGHPQAAGGGQAPKQSASDMTHGQEGYPGPRAGGESQKEADGDQVTPPAAGDTDPGSSQSADETGQAGDTTQPEKNKANPWNG